MIKLTQFQKDIIKKIRARADFKSIIRKDTIKGSGPEDGGPITIVWYNQEDELWATKIAPSMILSQTKSNYPKSGI